MALALERLGWQHRASQMRQCGVTGVVLLHQACGKLRLAPLRCRARTCPTCARRDAAVRVSRALGRVAAWRPGPTPRARAPRAGGWKLLTLTLPAHAPDRWDAEVLGAEVGRAVGASHRFWRRTPWGRQVRDPVTGRYRSRRDTAAIRAVEIGPSGNVHLHVLVYGEYVPQAQLQALWGEAVGEPLAILHIRAVHGDLRDALAEVLKYATKGSADPALEPARAAVVELAFRGRRRVDYLGALHGFAPSASGGAATGEAGAAGVELPPLCDHPTCPDPFAAWQRLAPAASEWVDDNGGFGPVGAGLRERLERLGLLAHGRDPPLPPPPDDHQRHEPLEGLIMKKRQWTGDQKLAIVLDSLTDPLTGENIVEFCPQCALGQAQYYRRLIGRLRHQPAAPGGGGRKALELSHPITGAQQSFLASEMG